MGQDMVGPVGFLWDMTWLGVWVCRERGRLKWVVSDDICVWVYVSNVRMRRYINDELERLLMKPRRERGA